MSEIINRVANSPIVSLDLEQYYPIGERVVFDLKPFLFQEIVLREKDFRQALKEVDWDAYKGRYVAVLCSADAIVPSWAFMLVMTYLVSVAGEALVGSLEDLEKYLMMKALAGIDPKDFEGRPVVVKGCSKLPVPLFAYGEVVRILKDSARSIMYGEPCSTVPLYKRPK